jgi:hypothetical protein
MKRLTSTLLLGVLLVFTMTASGRAAEQKSTITISPFLHEVRFSADEATKDFSIEITNSTNQPHDLSLSVLDFGSLNESGGVVFAGSDASTLVKKYGLATWLQLAQKTLTLKPNQTTDIQGTIINDTTMTPGGHYAAIIASIDSPTGKSGNEININQRLSALILATKVGGEKYDLKLDKISSDGSWLRLPREVSLKFSNPGNVHVVPRGKVIIKTSSGKVIAQGIINLESEYVFPETTRSLMVKLNTTNSSVFWPDTYHIQVDYRYDGIDQFARKDQTLFFFNLSSIVLVIVSLSLIFLIIKRFLKVKYSK